MAGNQKIKIPCWILMNKPYKCVGVPCQDKEEKNAFSSQERSAVFEISLRAAESKWTTGAQRQDILLWLMTGDTCRICDVWRSRPCKTHTNRGSKSWSDRRRKQLERTLSPPDLFLSSRCRAARSVDEWQSFLRRTAETHRLRGGEILTGLIS